MVQRGNNSICVQIWCWCEFCYLFMGGCSSIAAWWPIRPRTVPLWLVAIRWL